MSTVVKLLQILKGPDAELLGLRAVGGVPDRVGGRGLRSANYFVSVKQCVELFEARDHPRTAYPCLPPDAPDGT